MSEHIVFKGGTSLSKVYNLIKRFSEDVDLAIDRNYLGFEGMLTRGDIRKLRRASHDFSLNEVPRILQAQLEEYGIDTELYEIDVPNTEISDQDPEIIFINYRSVFEEEKYLPDRVQIEIGARSLNEPFSTRSIGSIIDGTFGDSKFVEEPFDVKSVIPEKTFLEKMILLHEEFQKPEKKIRSPRMSRHLYDIYALHNTRYGEAALADEELFRTICTHRAVFTPVRGVGYSELKLSGLNILPTGDFEGLYKDDYLAMRENMIYGESPKFEELIETVKKILM
ncbi:MAG TPA: nucleotidyl transferase AbiEii/AbiGii toxin family protein [Bacteroides sp.]|nr:nucleotidyl transferase AbiEii/AbiGii toxin family protein [Bacteroides sp.]